MGLENFKEYCNKWTDGNMKEELHQFAKDFLLDEANEVITRTKLRTPVDTGKLRASWQHGEVEENNNDFSVDILNETEYASYVEYGHKGVYVPALGKTMHTDKKYTTGKYMLTKSMNEVQTKMGEKFEKKFRKFLNDRGIGNG